MIFSPPKSNLEMPTATEPEVKLDSHANGHSNGHANGHKPIVSYDINLPYTELLQTKTAITYSEYLPTWDPVWYDPLLPFHFEDPALRVHDKSKPHLLTLGVTIQDIQPARQTHQRAKG